MPRTTKSQPKRGKPAPKSPRSARPKKGSPPLTPAEQAFQETLKPCLPKERLFVRHRLAGRSQAEAARLAGYSAKSAEDIGAQLSGRLRVYEAYQAGLIAAGFGPADILADIRALRSFDPAVVEREITELETVLIERPAEEVIGELLKQESAVERFLNGLDVDDESIVDDLKRKLRQLLHERLALEMKLAVNPQATTFAREQVAVTRRVVDEAKIRELGLSKFVKSRKLTKYGWAYEFYSWVDGVQMAAKTAGLFVERREVSGPNGGPVVSAALNVDDMSGEEIAQAYAQLLGQADES